MVEQGLVRTTTHHQQRLNKIRLHVSVRLRIRKRRFTYTVGDFSAGFWFSFGDTCTHLLAVADALLFEAQLPLQILDDGVLGSLNV